MKMAVTQCVRRDTQHGVISQSNFLYFVTSYDRIALSCLTESSGGDSGQAVASSPTSCQIVLWVG